MKKPGKITGFLSFVILMGLIGMIVLAYGVRTYQGAGPLSETRIVLIERGTGVSAIAASLEKEGVISSTLLFKIAAALQKDKGTLKAGEYEFLAHISLADAMTMMREGRTFDRKVTIPEGQTSYQIVQTLNKIDTLTGDITVIPKEGTLLPETYHFIRGDSRQEILDEMKSEMDKILNSLWAARDPSVPLKTPEEALTLASIVEKETGVGSERARIAGVFINRLNRGIPLQSDPTVIYALTKGQVKDEGQGPIGRRLLTADLSKDSPYNTYVVTGLPPGPIANPGQAALEAVLHPETHDYIYFVADGKGGHVFAKTLEEHNRNVTQWRKARKAIEAQP